MKKTVAAVFAMVLGCSLPGEADTIFGFTGPFAPEYWHAQTFLPTYYFFSSEALTLEVSGTRGRMLRVNVPDTSVITFDWELISNPVVFNGMTSVRGWVATPTEPEHLFEGPDKGTFSIEVPAGHTMTFAVEMVPWRGESGSFVVSNFRVESVPEPSAFGLLATGLVSVLGKRRHRRLCA